MTRRLRTIHRASLTVLALALPAAAALALRARPVLPAAEALPVAGPAVAPVTISTWERSPVAPDLAVQARAGLPREGGAPVLELTIGASLRIPDLLAYWAPGEAGPGAALPPGALLVGELPGPAGPGGPDGSVVRLPLPPEASAGAGWLVLFSLAHDAVVAAVPLPPLREERP